MTHKICFDGVENGWHNALPLGNGKFGAMVFFGRGELRIALNHYDVYYAVLPRYEKGEKPPAPKHSELLKTVQAARKGADYARTHYAHTLNRTLDDRPEYHLSSFPMAGEIRIPLHMETDSFSLTLYIEDARIVFTAELGGKRAWARVWAASGADVLFTELSQSEPGFWGDAELVFPSGRGLDAYEYQINAENGISLMKAAIRPGRADEIAFETALAAEGGAWAASVSRASAVEAVKLGLRERAKLKEAHGAWRRDFWRSSVTLPDKFLETLWHLHLYVIGCASGLGGMYPEQACGLNGLWDIRRPTLWGSMWYWDVNIQEAF